MKRLNIERKKIVAGAEASRAGENANFECEKASSHAGENAKRRERFAARFLAMLLAALLAAGACACSSNTSSDSGSLPSSDGGSSSPEGGSAKESTEKEEIVYANLSADGTVEKVYVVNVFGAGNVVDYGNYSEVEMLNTSDEITKIGDEITFCATAQRTYYKGILEGAALPWDISIKYFINGKEYTPEEAAGMSGKAEIRFSISKNEKCDTDFYENYAVQASFTFDSENFRNIKAEGATIANVGSDKQLTYTILPGEGISAAIYADVTEFEMASVSVNGVPLSIDIDVDYTSLTDMVGELCDAAGSINSGAQELSDGSDSLYSGITEIQDVLSELNGSSSTLTEGSGEVYSALKQIQSALSSVSGDMSEINRLVEGSCEAARGISQISEGAAALSAALSGYRCVLYENGLDLDYLESMNETAIESLDERISQVKSFIEKLKEKILEWFPDADTCEWAEEIDEIINTVIGSFENIEDLLKGDLAAIGGFESYIEQIAESAAALSAGAEALNESYGELDAGINTLASKLSGLFDSLSTLKCAINTLVSEYSKLDSGIDQYTDAVAQILAGYGEAVNGAEQLRSGAETLSEGTGKLYLETDGADVKISGEIDDMISSITGGDFDTVSFVSEKNTDVSMVQFVIKTQAVSAPTYEEEAPESEEEPGFWQRIFDLFS